MAKAKCSRSYHQLSPDLLDSFGAQIRAGMADNPLVFTTPPVSDAQFHTYIDNYITTRAAYKTGGSAQKPAYEDAKDVLMGALDDTADYVDEVADGDTGIIELAGFTATKTGGTDVPEPTKPLNVVMTRGETGELYGECDALPMADTFVAILAAGFPLPPGAMINASGQFVVGEEGSGPGPYPTSVIFDFTKGRKKKFMGLIPGTTYYIYFFAINATGVSPLSDVRSLMCG